MTKITAKKVMPWALLLVGAYVLVKGSEQGGGGSGGGGMAPFLPELGGLADPSGGLPTGGGTSGKDPSPRAPPFTLDPGGKGGLLAPKGYRYAGAGTGYGGLVAKTIPVKTTSAPGTIAFNKLAGQPSDPIGLFNFLNPSARMTPVSAAAAGQPQAAGFAARQKVTQKVAPSGGGGTSYAQTASHKGAGFRGAAGGKWR